MTLDEAIEMLIEAGDRIGMSQEVQAVHVSGPNMVIIRTAEMSSIIVKKGV